MPHCMCNRWSELGQVHSQPCTERQSVPPSTQPPNHLHFQITHIISQSDVLRFLHRQRDKLGAVLLNSTLEQVGRVVGWVGWAAFLF